MKRCSTQLVIQEMQIKTTMKYYFIPIKITIINKQTNPKKKITTVGKDVEKELESSYATSGNVK